MLKNGTEDVNAEVSSRSQKKGKQGLHFQRYFTKAGVHPFDEIEWELRTATISNDRGEKIFEQKDVEVPKSWSVTATNIVVSKYFYGSLGTPQRETSVRQLIDRVARTYYTWGLRDGYFASEEDANIFYYELLYLLVHQYMSFNSPVWFNVGVEEHPQCSACFINSVEDSMESILELSKTEGMLFKYGSGTGTNLSTLRSSKEKLSGGGTPSGPVSFMRGYDAFAGVIKSGGKTRRAAKMVILNIDHPDIVKFINCKAEEEKKAWALIDAGYDGGFNVPGGAYDSVFFQNANHSVRVTDEYMKAVLEDKEFYTKAVKGGYPVEKYHARNLMKKIADAAWICGDPGIQFHTTINEWHTCPNSAPINASNPCSEYMFVNDSACNLASLNLMKFRKPDTKEFDVEAFSKAIAITITAMEISVDNSSYPTPAITKNSHAFRPLGLGYANLGAYLMSHGIAYDSEAGRALAAAITSLMTAEAYKQSAKLSDVKGAFEEFSKNLDAMLNVMKKHREAAEHIDATLLPRSLYEAQCQAWDEVIATGSEFGFRNAQTTVLAPTGTIGFMMDCDTTGVEPDIALVKFKKMSDGGVIKIVNQSVPEALLALGYNDEQVEHIVAYIDKNNTIEGAPHLREEHLPVFDCAFKPTNGKRFIHYMGHIKMMSAVQPFLSGAISKTVNMPNEVTPEDIMNAYIEAWKLGLKAIAVYRDGCKRTQPLSTSLKKEEKQQPQVVYKPVRRRLPDERQSITHKFSIAGHEGYITVGMFEDGTPGEIFITMSKEGSTISGLMDSLATAVSIALQYGVPLKVLVDKFSHARYEPSGFTNNPEIPIAKSISDYIFRWLGNKFLKEEIQSSNDLSSINMSEEDAKKPLPILNAAAEKAASIMEKNEKFVFQTQSDAPLCHECGSIMIRSGNCYKCLECGSTSGCS